MEQSHKLEISPARRKELAAILKWHRVTYDDHAARLPWIFSDEAQSFETRLHQSFPPGSSNPVDQSNVIQAARLGGKIVGYYVLGKDPSAKGTIGNHVEDIHVDADFRRQGIGSALLQHATSLAQAKDWDALTAVVWQGNAASAGLFGGSTFETVCQTWYFGPRRPYRKPAIKKAGLPWQAFQWIVLSGLLGFIIGRN